MNSRIGATGNPLATLSGAGLLNAANFGNINNWFGKAVFNILDYGADPTGTNDCTAAFNAALAALAANSPLGGNVAVPPGNFLVLGPVTITTQGVEIVGSAMGASNIISTSATNDVFVVNNWYVGFKNLTFSNNVSKTAGYCVNAPSGYDYCVVDNCTFQGNSSTKMLYRAINMSNLIMMVRNVRLMNVSDCYIYINAGTTANQYMHNVLGANPSQLTTAGIYVASTASLLMSDCDIINGGPGALYVACATGTTIPSIEAVNCFFDTSTNGLTINNAGTGSVTRSKFTNCWFGNNTGAGINFAAAGGGIDGLTFANCDLYNNANGINFAAAVNNIQIAESRFAGNSTAGINIAASSSATFIALLNNIVGAQAGFGNNGTGIIVATGTYAGLIVSGNEVVGNTTAYTIGTVTCANWAQFRITDNVGINPKGAVTTPTIASATTFTNTTGYRVTVLFKSGATAPTVFTVNGVSTVLPLASQVMTVPLDPGGTINFTYTVAPTWTWVAN